jgi:hypothetical protein
VSTLEKVMVRGKRKGSCQREVMVIETELTMDNGRRMECFVERVKKGLWKLIQREKRRLKMMTVAVAECEKKTEVTTTQKKGDEEVQARTKKILC